MSNATLNVRMPEELKFGGDAVLEREGISVSNAVRGLYEYLKTNQDIPDFIRNNEDKEAKRELTRKRREALEKTIGILPPDTDIEAARYEYLMHKTRSGVRE
ncbi:MAG: hypothetical protein FWG24_06155 [Eggerthellaceae bacterium]|nr:hypothetical protein [Eggerthellaceae bacterium]MDR2722010.1 hypothetical protein [Coriobacteriaceae bacterium]